MQITLKTLQQQTFKIDIDAEETIYRTICYALPSSECVHVSESRWLELFKAEAELE